MLQADRFGGWFWTMATLACVATIGAAPVFSHWKGLSHIVQLLALGAVGLAGLTVFWRRPSVHPAILAYVGLVAIWGFSLEPGQWPGYFTLVKLAVLAVAVNLVIRTPRQLLLLFGIFGLSAAVTLVLNWSEVSAISEVMETSELNIDQARLQGTFENANVAGVFASTALTCNLIVFFNARSPWRWVIAAMGLTSSLVIGVLSGSRTGMIGMIIAGLSVPFLALAGERRHFLLKYGKALIVSTVALGLFAVVASNMPQLERVFRLSEGAEADGSTYARWGMAVEAVGIWKEYPFFGAGFEGFSRVSSQFAGRYSHTTFGEILANGGLVGFGLICVFYFVPAMQSFWLVQTNPQPAGRRIAAALLVFAGIFIFSSVFGVLHRSRDLIPLWAAICGVLQEQRILKAEGRRALLSSLNAGRRRAAMSARVRAHDGTGASVPGGAGSKYPQRAGGVR